MRIIHYLTSHKLALFIVIVLLMGQAFCDLSIPRLTSNIVDVGIQQSGVERVATEGLSASSYDAIKKDLIGADEQLFTSSYQAEPNGNYSLTDFGRKNLDELDKIMAAPLVRIHGLGDGSNDSLLEQQGVSAALKEYNQLGYDLQGMQMRYLVITGASMLGLAALGMIFAIAVGFVASRAGAQIGRDLRRKLFSKVIYFSDAEISRFSAASLITRGTNDIQLIQMISIMLMRMVLYAPILAIGGIIMVIYTNPSMGWIIVVAVLVVIAAIFILMRVTLPKFKIMQKLIDRVNLVSREMLTGLPVIRAFDREEYEQQRFDDANTNLMRTQLFTNRAMSFMMPTMMLIMNATSVAIVWFGGLYIDSGTIQTGDLIAFITYSMVIIMGFLMIGMISIMLPRAEVAAERIDEVLSATPSIMDPEYPKTLDTKTLDTGVANQNSHMNSDVVSRDSQANVENCETAQAHKDANRQKGAKIEFRDVCFRYEDSSECVLEHISFTVYPGQTLAIIGSTGSGKSSIIKLIERFYDVTNGAVLLDDVDIRDLTQAELRSNFGYVPQKAFLFSGTIDSNIAYSDEGMPEACVQHALEISQAADFVSEKPEGVNSPIVQAGTNVSGGQRQRLAIARAIATGARAFLFDDSFSALDYKTDSQLREALREHLGNTTCLIVAQRISTIMNADQIVVLEEGRIVGQGTHEYLMENCEEYRDIALSQLSEAELSIGGEAA